MCCLFQYSDIYRNSLRSSSPPHIFAVADASYQAIVGQGGLPPKNQCILIRYLMFIITSSC